MKKITILAGFLLLTTVTTAQNSTQWPAVSTPTINVNNTTTAGYVGLGIRPNSSSTTLPSFNFHLHGTSDFVYTTPTVYDKYGDPLHGYSQNFGKTTRFGMTNSTTGQTMSDGTVFQMSNNDFLLQNRENGDFTCGINGLTLKFTHTNQRLWLGNVYANNALAGTYNVNAGVDNGIYVRSVGTGAFGMSLNVKSASDGIQIYAIENAAVKNFKVTGAGEVFARKYTTTLSNIPDYVFADDYELMTFAELRTFVQNEKHLPNVPTAKEYETEGVDLGEMNRVLLEKVEELTLYILQLEERMQKVEIEKYK